MTLISNGIPPSRTSALRNALTAVDMDRPSSSRMAVASLLTSGSMRIVVAGMFDGRPHPSSCIAVRPFYRLYAAGAAQ